MASSTLRSTSELLAPAIEKTIAALPLADADAAAAQLARRYAATIDAAEHRTEAMEKLGPKLLAALESLGATPAARSRLRGGAPSRAENRLEVLRSARRA